MRSYPLYIDGQDRDGEGWNYTVKASALLADPINMFNLKRALDLGQMDPSEAPADVVVGRSAWSDRRTNAEALEAAARASREFRRTPLDVRRAMSDEYHDSIVERAGESSFTVRWPSVRVAPAASAGVLPTATTPGSVSWVDPSGPT